MLKDFREFAMRGNVLDLAIGVIIGAAFGKIVTSLVDDIIMPLIGLLLGGIDFSKLYYPFGQTKIHYGAFIQTVVDFLIISFSIFMFIRFISNFRRKEEQAEEDPEIDKKEELLMEIRDLLKEK